MGYLPTDSGHMYYEVEGNGFPLVFIHGMGLSHVNWRAQVDFFKHRGFKTVTIDTRGHGKSSPTHSSEGKRTPVNHLQANTRDLYQLLNKLEIEECFLVGYSTGTLIAQQFVTHYPERVKGTVISGAFPKISNLYLWGKFTAGLGLTSLNATHLLSRLVARSNGKDEAQITAFRIEASKVDRDEAIGLLKDALAFDCRDALPKIKTPILVTYGGNERHMMKYRHDYLTLCPAAEVVLFPEVNHATMTKKTESYNKVLLDFFQTILEHRDNYFLKPKIINPTPVPINTNLE
ncbi:pimeloyl-ACP methyl ester carboxylesterase [Caldalkalibacillus uzonensis]|uniref:Pimeloyl-ACP methyl ester carboxylesterase n=1 Tax=Caldalkalibacillus uzonensis TaxID=353224 RepID=A0ABU0CQF2_9BACI|nr:alpha/beta hydrolase [Caldalkalibacillus uzonensis]MDQ0337740.1 pimeloyl-ACP methyl ester carboxylesterase [Caldalkalibacillus uzonensis]